MDRNRVGGHSLFNEGAAYMRPDYPGVGWERVIMNSVAGEGVGLCTCGAASEILESGNARKKWHRDHKASLNEEEGL